jgi:hypothetical protein
MRVDPRDARDRAISADAIGRCATRRPQMRIERSTDAVR